MPFVSSKDRAQMMMTSFEQMVDHDSIARVIDVIVDCFNLEEMGFKAAVAPFQGRPPYPASCMLKLFLYGGQNNIRSSRKLMEACHINIEAKWLMNLLEPDFRTISNFRKDNVDSLKKAFKEFNSILKDYVDTGFLSVDGSKFFANNSKDKNFTAAKLNDRISWLEVHCEEYLRLLEESDDREFLEGEFTKQELDAKLAEATQRLELYRKYLAYMEENNLSQLSLTDHDAKLMKMRYGFGVSYNVQTAVDSETHLIKDYNVTDNPTDCGELYETVKDIKNENPDAIMEVTADKGYRSGDDLAKCLEEGVIPHVKLEDGKDTCELEVDYEESTCDPGSIAPEEIKKCLRAGVIPDVYKEYISDIKIEEKTVFKDVSLEEQIKRYPFSSYDEMLKKASEGYYVRDPEKNLVICPAGKSLYCIGETKSGNMRFKNKMACKSCPHKSMCNSNKKGYNEVQFNKDSFVRGCRKWLKAKGKESDVKATSRTRTTKKIVTITFRPNKEKMAERMCLSEHPFGTIKRAMNSAYFLLRGKKCVQGEFALFALGYNIKRAINLLGFDKLMEILAEKILFFSYRSISPRMLKKYLFLSFFKLSFTSYAA